MQLLDSCPLAQAQFASLSILLQINLPTDEERNSSSDAAGADGDSSPTIVKNVSSEDIESFAPNTPAGVEMVECKTPDGGTKRVPKYPKGTTIYYKNILANTKTPAKILDVHLDDLLLPYYTIRLEDGKEKQTDNAHIRLDKTPTDETDEGGDIDAYSPADDNGPSSSSDGMEADKSAGPPTAHPRRILRHAILRESLTVVSPLTLLPEGACKRTEDTLHRFVMEEFGMRDDFMGIGSKDDSVDDEKNDGKPDRSEEDNDDDDDDGNKMKRVRSRVRFQEDTKEGAQESSAKASSGASNEQSSVPFGSTLPVKIYQPPRHHLNCSLGLTMFYVAAYVEDVSQLAKKSGSTNNNTSRKENDATQAFYNCASVLLPGVSLSSLSNSVEGMSSNMARNRRKQRECSGVILLTIGTTGPAYDLYGASTVIATLPERLRDGMNALAKVDTTPKEVQMPTDQPPLHQDTSPKKKKSKGKNGSPTAAATVSVQLSPQRVSYDAAYFKRIYTALLATLIDDEDGLMRDHDEVVPPTTMSDSYRPEAVGELFSSTAAVVGSYVPSQRTLRPPPLLTELTESTTGLMADQAVTSSGTAKKKLFTFSRKKSGKSKSGMMEYESGDQISGGEPDSKLAGVGGAGSAEDSSGVNNAEIVRRTAQKLEVLSLVEDDMDLPKYSHAPDNSKGGGRRGPPTPRRKVGGHNAGQSSGRFGRLPVTSDLAGFEYRPPAHPQRSGAGGVSSGGTAATSLTGASSIDDGSVQTGDDTATVTTAGSRYTVGSQSSVVPTLSKSKRDSSKTTTGTSRSRFLRRKKKESKTLAEIATPATRSVGNEAAKQQQAPTVAKNKPPLFPQQHQQQQLVYDPFSMDEEDEEEQNYERGQQEDLESIDQQHSGEGSRSVGSTSTVQSAASASTSKEDAAQATPELSQAMTPGHESAISAPLSPAPKGVVDPPYPEGVGNAINRSFSEESDGVRTEQSQHSVASIGTESAASIMTERDPTPARPEEPHAMDEADVPEEELAAAEPTRHLDIGLALNEDLTCEYKGSKLSSLTMEGTVQVRVTTRHEEGPAASDRQPVPFFLVFRDHSGHIKALQENKKFVENVTHEQGDAIANREFTYTIKVPREEEYFPVVRYKCGNSLRPVPIRVQSRVRTQGKHVRIALQISSNPQNPSDLVHLTIIMSVPPGVRGDSLKCNPPGGVWNQSKRVVLWCVSELGGGEKFQLQSVFEIEEEFLDSLEGDLDFPVLARCQCSGAQLSDVALEVSNVGSDIFPAEVSKSVVRRFRVSHKESNG